MVRKVSTLLLLVLATFSAWSQCTGSLGTPIVNETFGAGTNIYGPELPAGITNLQFLSDECPNDGQYSIVNYTSGCYNAWNTVTDHTGDKNGYFMLINASYQPSDFFVQTVSGLCDGTTYEFSAWVLNMFMRSGGINPNITFTIEKTDGTVLSSYQSGDILFNTPPLWKKYGFYFTTPVGISTVVLRMHNNAPGGGGNDLGLDDITFSPAGPVINVATTGSTGSVVHVLCSNKTTLTASVATCYVKNAYQWQTSADGNSWSNIPGATNPDYSINLPATGTYLYRLNVAEDGNIENVSCRANSNVFTVIYDPPTISNITTGICAGTSYTLPSGKTVNAAGVYTDTAPNKQGCDSIITNLNLGIKPLAYATLATSICEGESYNGHTTSGTYTDTFVAYNGCDSVLTLNLTVKKKSYTTLNVSICQGDSYKGRTLSGIYTDTLTAYNGCDSLVTTNLNVINLKADLGNDRVICLGDSLLLQPGIFSSYLWQDNSTMPYYKVTTAGTYWVTVTNDIGCTATGTITIKEVDCSFNKIPNAFTPNSDGINDTWNVVALEAFPQCTVSIYTRWGQLVFKSAGYPRAWDGRYNGKDMPTGTYYYIIDLKNGKPPVSGHVTLIR